MGVPIFFSSLASGLGFVSTEQAVQLFQKHVSSGAPLDLALFAEELNEMHVDIRKISEIVSKQAGGKLLPWAQRKFAAQYDMCASVEDMRLDARGRQMRHELGNCTFDIVVKTNAGAITVAYPSFELHIVCRTRMVFDAFVTEYGEIGINNRPGDLNVYGDELPSSSLAHQKDLVEAAEYGPHGEIGQYASHGTNTAEYEGPRSYGTVVQAVADLILKNNLLF